MQKYVNFVDLVESLPTIIHYSLAEVSVDTTDNEPLKIRRCLEDGRDSKNVIRPSCRKCGEVCGTRGAVQKKSKCGVRSLPVTVFCFLKKLSEVRKLTTFYFAKFKCDR